MPEYDDDTLEQIMRDGLELRAGSAGTRLADRPGERPVVPPRRGRLLVAAAVVGLAAAGGVAFAVVPGSSPGQVAVDSGPVPGDWRYESYDGLQVQVPPTWGWGGAPTQVAGETMSCGTSSAFVVPGSNEFESVDASTPFVARPAMMSDACLTDNGGLARPKVDAVWLGSTLPVGTDTSGAETAQTVAVGSQHVTVFSDDAALRARILATAEAVQIDGNGCPTAPVEAPAPGPTDNPSPDGLSVCVYQQGKLLWSTRKDAQQAQAYVDAFSRASATYDAARSCTTPPSFQWVAIKVDTGAGPTRWDIANFDCPALVGTYTYGNQGKQSDIEAPLVADTVAPWAGGGIKAYVAGPVSRGQQDAALAPYFRGMLG